MRMVHPDLPGQPIDNIRDDHAEVLAQSGWVKDAEEGDYAPGGPSRPADGAGKATWVEYAVAKGADPAAADALTRDALVEQYG